MAETKRAVIVEHRYLIRAGVEHFLAEMPGIRVEALFEGSEKELYKRILMKKPDVLIINPVSAGNDLVKWLNKLGKHTVVIALTGGNADPRVVSHFKYLFRQTDSKQQLQKILRESTGLDKNNVEKNALSSREITVLKQIVQGFTNRQIADNLFLSIHTVTTHRKNIHRKLGINTVSGLTVYALMNRLVTLPETRQKD